MNNIKTLLSQVSDISKKFEEIARLTGENYNVFKILKLTTAEVKTHSAFIGELLNPNGSHDHGDDFLQFFLEMLKEKLNKNDFEPIAGFNCNKARAKVEKSIGKISDGGNKGGQIDIIITDDNKKAIIIENKIHAKDQWKQLIRYNSYGENKHKDSYILLYLTLYGTTASIDSTGKAEESTDSEAENVEKEEEILSKEGLETIENIKEKSNLNVINLSYKKDILSWLEKCKEKAVNHPMLRESIAQYINLIKLLTHQTINKRKGKEMINTILASKENLDAYTSITKDINHEQVKKEAWRKIEKTLQDKMSKKPLEFEIASEDTLKKEKKVVISFKNKDSEKSNFFVWLGLENEVDKGLIIGLFNCKGIIDENIAFKFKDGNSNIKYARNKSIVYKDYPSSSYRNWYLKDLNNVLFSKDNKFYDDLIKKVGEIFEAIKD